MYKRQALSHALMSPARHVSKVYEAEIEGEMAKDAVQRFAQGMTLKDGTVCRPAKLEHVPAACGQCVRITLQEGKYHQVKRMVAAAGGVVAHLRRVRLGGLSLDPKLAPGEYRLLREEEVVLLRQEPEDEPIG